MFRLILLMVFVICGPVWAAADSGVPLSPKKAESSYITPSLNEGIDRLSASLTKAIAARYFDAEKKPVIKVAVFEFTDQAGNITVGSRYISNRIRLAVGNSPQFALVLPKDLFNMERGAIAESFRNIKEVRERIVGDMRADAYLFGRIDASDPTSVTCQVDIWGTLPPYTDFSKIGSLKDLQTKENAIDKDVISSLPWRLTLTASGLAFFNHVLVHESGPVEVGGPRNFGEVIFLSQPICDDLDLSWQITSEGMVFDTREDKELGILQNRTGQVMQSRIKSPEDTKGVSYVIKTFGLAITETGGESIEFQAYSVPMTSSFYFIPYRDGYKGFRFKYLWARQGLSQKPADHESGKGWKLFSAEKDYRNIMPVGSHTATATFRPMVETELGSKTLKAEYISKFKFVVGPGLNIYTVNYAYRNDRPMILVQRLEMEGSKEEPVRAVKRITEVYRVYGE